MARRRLKLLYLLIFLRRRMCHADLSQPCLGSRSLRGLCRRVCRPVVRAPLQGDIPVGVASSGSDHRKVAAKWAVAILMVLTTSSISGGVPLQFKQPVETCRVQAQSLSLLEKLLRVRRCPTSTFSTYRKMLPFPKFRIVKQKLHWHITFCCEVRGA
jgi:hypothetical protein